MYEDLYFLTYLFNGQLGVIGALTAIGLLWQHSYCRPLSWLGKIGAVLGLFCANGCYELSMILVNVVLLLLLFDRFRHRPESPLSGFLPAAMLISLILMTLSLSAPGNFQRMDTFAGSGDLPRAILLAVGSIGYLLFNWFSDTQFIMAALIFLTIGKGDAASSGALASMSLFKLLAAGLITLFLSLTFSFLAVGATSFPERLEDLLWLEFLLWSVLWIRAIKVRWPAKATTSLPHFATVALCCCLMLNVFGKNTRINRTMEKPGDFDLLQLTGYFSIDNNVARAWQTLLTGRAAQYNSRMNGFYEQLRNSEKTGSCP